MFPICSRSVQEGEPVSAAKPLRLITGENLRKLALEGRTRIEEEERSREEARLKEKMKMETAVLEEAERQALGELDKIVTKC